MKYPDNLTLLRVKVKKRIYFSKYHNKGMVYYNENIHYLYKWVVIDIIKHERMFGNNPFDKIEILTSKTLETLCRRRLKKLRWYLLYLYYHSKHFLLKK